MPSSPAAVRYPPPLTIIRYVAAEYGAAKLSGLSLPECAEAVASIARLGFQEELPKYAHENFR